MLLRTIVAASLGAWVVADTVIDDFHNSHPRISMLRTGGIVESSLSPHATTTTTTTIKGSNNNSHHDDDPIIKLARSPGMQPTDLVPSEKGQQQQTHRQTQGKNVVKEANNNDTPVAKSAPIKVKNIQKPNKAANNKEIKQQKNDVKKQNKNNKLNKNTIQETSVPSVMVTPAPTPVPTQTATSLVPTAGSTPSVMSYVIISRSPTMIKAPTPAPSVAVAKPIQLQTIELSLSIGVQDSGIRDASSALMSVIETSNLAENSEQALQDTFIKLRKGELLKTTSDGLMTLLNDEIDNLIVRPNAITITPRDANRSLLLPQEEQESLTDTDIRDLKQTRIAKFIILGNKPDDSSLNDAGDNLSALGLEWFHIKLSYAVWYEVIAYEHESGAKFEGSSHLPKGLDKESLKSIEMEEFLSTDTEQLVNQLNDVIAKSIDSQKLVKLLHKDDDSIVSVSQLGQEQNATRLPLPPAEQNVDVKLSPQSLKELSPFKEPLDTKKMTSIQTSGLVLFLITLVVSLYMYRTANHRKTLRAEQCSVSLSSQQGMESILASSRNLPHYLNHIVTHQQDRTPSSPDRSSLASSRLSSAISSRVDEDKLFPNSTPTRSRLKHPKTHHLYEEQSPYDERSTAGSSYHHSTQADDSSYKYMNDMESVKEERDLEII